MPTCDHCGGEFDVEELVRHERDGVHHVHCPDCEYNMGTYNDHSR